METKSKFSQTSCDLCLQLFKYSDETAPVKFKWWHGGSTWGVAHTHCASDPELTKAVKEAGRR
jgi:hypothetical protein